MVTINEIRNLSNTKRDEIRDELKPRIYDYLYFIGWAKNPKTAFSCPVCGKGTKTPNTSVNPETFRITSWSCHCLDNADLFDIILMNEPTVTNTFEALVFACNLYNYSLSAGMTDAAEVTHEPRRYIQQPELERPEPPSIEWQTEAKRFVNQCEANLWQPAGAKALEYLTEKRKLKPKTLRHFHIGYNPRSIYKDRKIIAAAGITIPTFVHDDLFRVKVRTDSGKPKYLNYTGSENCCPFNGTDLLHEVDVIIVEGEIDVMTIYQANQCGAVTFGSSTSIPSAVTWREWLKNPDRICITFDADEAGRDGEQAMLSEIKRLENIRPVDSESVYINHLPFELKEAGGEDWNDFFTSGGDIVGLLNSFFPL